MESEDLTLLSMATVRKHKTLFFLKKCTNNRLKCFASYKFIAKETKILAFNFLFVLGDV